MLNMKELYLVYKMLSFSVYVHISLHYLHACALWIETSACV
jgi:hypothetical protein